MHHRDVLGSNKGSFIVRDVSGASPVVSTVILSAR